MATLPLMVPLPFEITQVWVGVAGCFRIVTAYAAFASSGVANVKFTVPVPFTTRSSPALSCRVKPDPRSPLTVPPTVNTCAQRTWILVTAAVAGALPLGTLQVWEGFVGWGFAGPGEP